eukprot:3365795-Amphidinium_carterae.1
MDFGGRTQGEYPPKFSDINITQLTCISAGKALGSLSLSLLCGRGISQYLCLGCVAWMSPVPLTTSSGPVVSCSEALTVKGLASSPIQRLSMSECSFSWQCRGVDVKLAEGVSLTGQCLPDAQKNKVHAGRLMLLFGSLTVKSFTPSAQQKNSPQSLQGFSPPVFDACASYLTMPAAAHMVSIVLTSLYAQVIERDKGPLAEPK